MRVCCVEGAYTLFMLCHSLQLIDYERVMNMQCPAQQCSAMQGLLACLAVCFLFCNRNMMLWLSSCVGLFHVPLKALTKCNVNVTVPGTVKRVTCA